MSKLSFDALKERADAVVTEELMNEINGGKAECHPGEDEPEGCSVRG